MKFYPTKGGGAEFFLAILKGGGAGSKRVFFTR